MPKKRPEQLDKEFRPESVESAWYARWLSLDLFRAQPDADRAPFVIVIPPPNITGTLHVGHALDNTLQDVLVRWHRMKGDDTLWLPGIDHAGIATQMVVERELRQSGQSRHEIGRERFLEKVWEWKDRHGGAIVSTLQRLGCSCDWSRLRFTLDEGLIYRQKALINWCPSCRTALSDLEVDRKDDETSHLWHIAYPIEGSDRRLVVATTRPETMLGDTGVAIHPDDERYAGLAGARVILPLLDRPIPIVEDAVLVDPKFGTGVVKVTPAHDFNDFEAGKRNGLEALTVLDDEGKINENGGPYAGLDRFEARERIVADLEARGLLVKVEEHTYALAVCNRCRTILEPRLSTQWFVRIAPLAGPALAAVEDGRIDLIPATWKKTYYEWMRNIHDWCISRQLWWGHRIPAWYCARDHITVSREDPACCATCGDAPVRQDDDVLDTWFSSALWPFSTMGWPADTPDLRRYYPTSVLVTGPDILFFWVARMIMMGLKFRNEVPFRAVYLHGLIRDAKGRKMSKTLGNSVEPEEIMARYGTDAVRFTLAIGASPGPSVPLSPQRLDGYRAFANKTWNATRFVLMNLRPEEGRPDIRPEDLTVADRWILSATSRLAEEVNRHLAGFRFDLAANALYHFIWHTFCDWYIEIAKPTLTGPAAGTPRGRASRAVLLDTLDILLRLLHPFMPFLTEELWQKLPRQGAPAPSISIARFPEENVERIDPEAEALVQEMIEVVTRARNLRAEAGIEPARRIQLLISSEQTGALEAAEGFRETISGLCQAERVEISPGGTSSGAAIRTVAGRFELEIPLAGLLDVSVLGEKIRKDLRSVESDLDSRRKKLANPSFADRAPAEIVEKERRIEQELAARQRRLAEILSGLSGPGRPGAAPSGR
jgi:valyl-tRNA synthetase